MNELSRIAKFLRVGRISEKLKTEMEAEGGLLFLAEGVPITTVLRGFSMPGRRSSLRSTSYIGYMALSNRRMVVRANLFDQTSMNLPYDDARFRRIAFTIAQKHLMLAFDAEGMIPKATGQVTIRVRLSNARDAAEILRDKGAEFAGVARLAA